jgi:hypothetical protein
MENLNEQEQIKDPNQLDLFAGILLTPEQEVYVANHILNNRNHANSKERTIAKIERLLIGAGFKKGIDFENDFKRKIVTKTVTLGYNYNNTNFDHEVTFDECTGDIKLKVLRHSKGEITTSNSYVEIEDDKLRCSSITDQYRFYKPKTLLEKFRDYNEQQKENCESFNKRKNLKQSVVDKYTQLYPNATVEVKADYSKYGGHYEVIEVKFASGSYVQFRLSDYKNEEFVHKKFDAEVDKMDAIDVLNKFSKQEALK